MAIFGKQTSDNRKLVVTGKRQKGIWTMESMLEPKARRSRRDPNVVLDRENRRIRTLH